MILHSLHVENWRNLLESVALDDLSERLNVIHAPNGSGKSSLFEAMYRCLFDRHDVSGQEIQAVRPWGREVSPTASVELSLQGTRYRAEKTFLDSSKARLLRWEENRFRPIADGRQADTTLRELLQSEAPKRGVSKRLHWGLAQALWVPQGDLKLEALSSVPLENIRAALGAQITGPAAGKLEERIEERYLEYFTRKGQLKRGKQGAPLVALEEEKAKLEEERQAYRQLQEQFEEASRAVEDSRQKRAQARREADTLRAQVEETRRQAEQFKRLQSELQQKKNAEQAARNHYEHLANTIQQITAAREEITACDQSLEETSRSQKETEQERAKADEALANAKTGLNKARARREEPTRLQEHLTAARKYLKARDDLQQLESRIDRLKIVEQELAREKESRHQKPVPTQQTLRDLRKHLQEQDQLQAKLDASLIHLKIRAHRRIQIHPDQGEPRTVEADETTECSDSPQVSIDIPEIGRITATGPETDVPTLHEKLKDTRSQIAELTHPFGTQDPEQLQSRLDWAQEKDQAIHHLQKKRAELLGDDDWDALSRRQSELKAEIAQWEHQYPDWQEAPPQLSELESTLESKRREIEDAIEEAEARYENAQTAHQAAVSRQQQLASELKSLQRQRERAVSRLTELTSNGKTDEARESEKQEALMSWEAARNQARQYEADLAQYTDDPQKTLQKLQKQLEALETTETEARDAEKTAEGILRARAEEGAYSKWATSEEALAELEQRIHRERRKTEAIRLLHETVAQCKRQTIAAVASPVEKTAARMLARVAGPRLGQIRFSESFVPTTIQPESSRDPVDLSNLSGGETEQLYLITRLALAQFLAKQERQLVVLDDVLNATDTARLARLLTLLEESSDQLQIVMLTCHPERYRALENAKFFAL